MNSWRPSRTASIVAYLRAVADAGGSHVEGFRDPTARSFLMSRGLQRLAEVETQLRRGRIGPSLAFTRVRADMLALRTVAIDAAVRNAAAAGIRQVVILGAGLDGRAWRMPELTGASVFEVDHPATQAFKQARVGVLPPALATVTFVPVDFEHDPLEAALAHAGHHAAQPTCWIWEGVVMYLTQDTTRATLATVASQSAEGSTLIVNYHTDQHRRIVAWYLRLLGEPLKGHWSPEEMAGALNEHGFQVVEDSGLADWAARYATGKVESRHGRHMRIAVAQKEKNVKP